MLSVFEIFSKIFRFGASSIDARLSSVRRSLDRNYRGSRKRVQEDNARPKNQGYSSILSPPQVKTFLTLNEASSANELRSSGPIKYFDSNQLSSNITMEDRRSVGRLLQTGGSLFGVFDGHGGEACAQVMSEWLFEYIATYLLPGVVLEEYWDREITGTPLPILDRYKFPNDYVYSSLQEIYWGRLQNDIGTTLSAVDPDQIDGLFGSIGDRLKYAFVRLDEDMSIEAREVRRTLNRGLISTVLSGSCACVVHVKDLDVHVGNAGDCRAVIGRQEPNGQWTAQPLTFDHNAENAQEAQRVKDAHPESETCTVIDSDRLLGQLMPFRAFGDVQFKWSSEDLKHLETRLGPPYANSLIPSHYHTPPYLIATPEVTSYRLKKSDRFLVLASDGLWETMSNETVVQIVGEHLETKNTSEDFSGDDDGILKRDEISATLRNSRKGQSGPAAADDNGATNLIRHALGYDHRTVSAMLTLPPQISRFYRDDITITVVYFNENYLAENAV